MPRSPAPVRKTTAAKTAAAARAAQPTLEAAAEDAAVTAIADGAAATLAGAANGRPKGAPRKPAAPPAGTDGFGLSLVDVDVELLDESEHNPRTTLTLLAPLMESVRAHGVIEPLVVTPTDGGRYRIVAGHRRAAAAKLARLKTVPCVVRPAGDDDLAEMVARMVENLQRVDLDPVEEARGYARLKDLGMKQKSIAEAVGRNQGHVSKRLVLLSLPESIQARVGRPEDDGGVTLEQAVEVGRLPGRAQIAVAEATHADDDAKFKGGWTFDQAIAKAGREHRSAAEVVDVIKRLRAAKVTVLNLAGDEISDPPKLDREDGPAALYWLHGVDPAAHAKLPCHALILNRSPYGVHHVESAPDGDELVARWTTTVCTDPASHAGEVAAVPAGARSASSPSGDVVDAEREAKLAAIVEAEAARTAFALDLVHGKVAAIMRDYVLRGQIRDAVLGREYYLTDVDSAAELVARAEADDLPALLSLGVTGSADRLVRAAFACRLDADLDAVQTVVKDITLYGVDRGWAPSVVDAAAFFELASKVGYTPHAVELAALDALAAAGIDPVRSALAESDLLPEPADEPAAEVGPDGWAAVGVGEETRARAANDGIPYSVWLDGFRQVPTGRCATCSGPAKALTLGKAGRHAPGGGSVRKGEQACPGVELLTLAQVAAADATGPDPVACSTCEATGRLGGADPDADIGSLPICPDCSGAGVVAPAPAEAPAG